MQFLKNDVDTMIHLYRVIFGVPILLHGDQETIWPVVSLFFRFWAVR